MVSRAPASKLGDYIFEQMKKEGKVPEGINNKKELNAYYYAQQMSKPENIGKSGVDVFRTTKGTKAGGNVKGISSVDPLNMFPDVSTQGHKPFYDSYIGEKLRAQRPFTRADGTTTSFRQVAPDKAVGTIAKDPKVRDMVTRTVNVTNRGVGRSADVMTAKEKLARRKELQKIRDAEKNALKKMYQPGTISGEYPGNNKRNFLSNLERIDMIDSQGRTVYPGADMVETMLDQSSSGMGPSAWTKVKGRLGKGWKQGLKSFGKASKIIPLLPPAIALAMGEPAEAGHLALEELYSLGGLLDTDRLGLGEEEEIGRMQQEYYNRPGMRERVMPGIRGILDME